MAIQLNPQSARVSADLNLNNQVAGPSANRAFDTANSSLVSMSHAQEGIGDFFVGVWNFVTYPFRAVWNLFFGSSTAPDQTGKEKADGVSEDFAALFDRKKTKKIKADDFRAAFEALPEEEQKAFKAMLWAEGGHKGPIKHKGKWEDVLIGKKKFDDADRRHLKNAFAMMDSREKLKEMAERFSEKDLRTSDVRDVRKELFDKLSNVVKTKIEKLGNNVGYATTVHHAFRTNKDMAPSYAFACKQLAEGNFVLVSEKERRELAAMRRNLDAAAAGGGIQPGDVATCFAQLSEKNRKLVADAVSVAAECPGKGADYIHNRHYDKNRVNVPVNPVLVRDVVNALSVFDIG